MDMSMVPIIFVVLFLVACLTLFLVYKYGIQEKSYEEALAEQRQHTQALLSNKPKPKDKKNKKATKKTKEKEKHDDDASKQSENNETDVIEHPPRSQSPQKLHVEFKQETEEVPNKEVVNIPVKKKVKKDVRPILLNKESENIVDAALHDPPPANHFEEIHPKDEFELLRSNSREELLKAPKEKSKGNKHHSENGEQAKKKDEQAQQEASKEKTKVKEQLNGEQNKDKKKTKTVSESEPPAIEKSKDAKPQEVRQQEKSKDMKPQEKSNQKEKEAKNQEIKQDVKQVQEKPKEKEFKLQVVQEKLKEPKVPTIAAIGSQTNGLVANNSGKEKKKKKGDLNNMQAFALDKEGASMSQLLNLVRKAELCRSEVQILIDLLLNKQHEAPAVVDEWSEGKFDPVQKLKKQLAEKEKVLLEGQEALVGVQAKLREIRQEQLSERSQLQQKIRGLEEVVQTRQLEIQALNNRSHTQTQQYQQLQAQLNDERAQVQMQIQQYEIRMAQAQEAEGIIVQLRADLQGLSDQNQQLRLELQRLVEEKDDHHQNLIVQLNNYQEDLKKKTEHIRHLESNLEVSLRKEDEFSVEISRLEAICNQNLQEIHDLDAAKNNALDEVTVLKGQNEELEDHISQLKTDLQKVLQEKSEMEEQQANGNAEEDKSYEVEILNLQNELSSLKNDRQQTEKKYKMEMESSRDLLEKLEIELKEQKEKNNELRTRNWKVMEALNAAENRIRDSSKTDINVEKMASEIQSKELQLQKDFMVRLFPEVSELKAISASSEKWQEECTKLIQDYVQSLKDVQNIESPPSQPSVTDEELINELRAENQLYKDIVDETKEKLNAVEKSVHEEEIKWRNQLQVKEEELQALKQQLSSQSPHKTHAASDEGVEFAFQCIERSLPTITEQLKEKVSNLEKELEEQQTETERLNEECRLLKSKVPDNESFVMVEKLTEEVNHLREQLQIEQAKNKDVNSSHKGVNNCAPTNGPALLQHCLSTSSSNASLLTEVTIRKPKSKKKKKKETGN